MSRVFPGWQSMNAQRGALICRVTPIPKDSLHAFQTIVASLPEKSLQCLHSIYKQEKPPVSIVPRCTHLMFHMSATGLPGSTSAPIVVWVNAL